VVSGAVLSALAGFAGALVVLGIPMVAWGYRVDRNARKAVRLLTGEDEMEGDGVLPRLAEVEDVADEAAREASMAAREAARAQQRIERDDDEGDTETLT